MFLRHSDPELGFGSLTSDPCSSESSSVAVLDMGGILVQPGQDPITHFIELLHHAPVNQSVWFTKPEHIAVIVR